MGRIQGELRDIPSVETIYEEISDFPSFEQIKVEDRYFYNKPIFATINWEWPSDPEEVYYPIKVVGKPKKILEKYIDEEGNTRYDIVYKYKCESSTI